jgi:uridine monophosphate synthetase
LSVVSFFEQLEARALEVNSLLCVGLDPHPDTFSAVNKGSIPTHLVKYCRQLIEATADQAVAFKPNAAFFEFFGAAGTAALQEVIASVPEGIPVILDAKRGDIASTAKAYVGAVFSAMGAGAVTVNPYLGRDAVEPFLTDTTRAVFLLCKTSNPGSGDLQNLIVWSSESELPRFLYEEVARMALQLNKAGNLGLVVGATHPRELARVRQIVPDMWILSPGIGTQGGDLLETLSAGLRADGLGLLFNVSRGISQTNDPAATAARIREEINQARRDVLNKRMNDREGMKQALPHEMKDLADRLLESGCVKFGRFTLKSGLESPIYMDLRRLVSFPSLLAQVSTAYIKILKGLVFDRLAGLPYAALPIATAISLQAGWAMVYPRKESKTYGTKAEIEGGYTVGEKVVVIDDLTTTGTSKFEAIEKLVEAGLRVKDVVVLIDRQSGASEALARSGYQLHAVFTLSELLDHWEHNRSITASEIAAARAFIESTRS